MASWKIRFNNDFFIHIISIEIYCFHIEMQNEVVKCFVLIGTGANCDKYKLILNKFWVLITNNSKIFNKCTNGVLSHTRDTGQVENLCYILFRYHFLLDSFFLKVLDMFDTYKRCIPHSSTCIPQQIIITFIIIVGRKIWRETNYCATQFSSHLFSNLPSFI